MLKENLSFVGICVLVFAALLGLAYLFERTVCHDLQRRSRSRNISYVAMFSALGGVLMLLSGVFLFRGLLLYGGGQAEASHGSELWCFCGYFSRNSLLHVC